MRIGRKEALIAILASLIPTFHRKASAQVRLKDPVLRTTTQSTEITDLQKRVAALEARLANEVGFTRDSYGNLNLRANANVTFEAGGNMTIRAGGQLQVNATGPFSARGSTIALN